MIYSLFIPWYLAPCSQNENDTSFKVQKNTPSEFQQRNLFMEMDMDIQCQFKLKKKKKKTVVAM